jgi:hypothetical protein
MNYPRLQLVALRGLETLCSISLFGSRPRQGRKLRLQPRQQNTNENGASATEARNPLCAGG